MSTTWQLVHQRGQQTVAVWQHYADTFTVGTLTLNNFNSAVAALPTMSQAVATQQDALDDARAARDATAATIRDLAVRMPRKMDGDLVATDALQDDLRDVRVIEMNGLESIMMRGQRVLSLWKKYNLRLVAAAQPALLVGGTAAAALETALGQLPVLTQQVEDARSVLGDARNALRAQSALVDADSKRWYAAWQGEFAPGSAEIAALSQIDTGSPTPEPEALEIASLAAAGAGAVLVTYAADGGAHATTLVLEWKLPAEAEFGHAEPVARPAQTVTSPAFAGQLVAMRTLGSNSSGATPSAVATVQM
ncbi:MAG: hypothetical protein K8R23_07570 [Chthoniobacter sp.]|nr:hypothetical protein [Chthoniobacter sp.]